MKRRALASWCNCRRVCRGTVLLQIWFIERCIALEQENHDLKAEAVHKAELDAAKVMGLVAVLLAVDHPHYACFPVSERALHTYFEK